MNDEQFEAAMDYLGDEGEVSITQQLRARDTAQHEALARVEADNRQLQLIVNSHANMRDTAQTQLAEAVGLLREIESAKVIFNVEKFELNRRLVALLARHAQVSE